MLLNKNNPGSWKKIYTYTYWFNRKCINLLELLVVVGGWKYKEDVMSSSINFIRYSNTHQLGLVMYTDYILIFSNSWNNSLLAMIGAILLTFRERSGVKNKVI